MTHAANQTGVEPTEQPSALDHAQKLPLFGVRSFARRITAELGETRVKAERAQHELATAHEEMERLGVMEVAALERERDRLQVQVEAQRTTLRKEAAEARARMTREKLELEGKLAELRQAVVTTEETSILQEVGVYEYRHPLDDSVAYKDELSRLQGRIKFMARTTGGAIEAATGWMVNGSAAEGKRMVRDFSKLMLRAYNAEADNLVRGMKPYKVDSAIDRLEKVAAAIERLGKTMDIRVSTQYHALRVEELELTADYREMQAREKEQERAERARLREEKKAQQELERERQRLDKERKHYANALKALLGKGDVEGAERLRAQLADIDKAIEDVDYRAANVRAGYVYVISNLGAFGEHMIKVGMTRRLEPIDRIRELSDASVPFNFDVHALFFSDDAVGIEAEMHRRLADRRVNQVNLRREFFYATPHEAKQHLLDLTGELLSFEETPEAVEFHQSRSAREAAEALAPSPAAAVSSTE
jgi:hypothetical protein